MKQNKLILSIVLILVVTLLTTGCRAIIRDNGENDSVIPPYSQGGAGETAITLYRYMPGLQMLSPVTYTCSVPVEVTLEKYMLDYMISKMPGNKEFRSVLNPATSVKEIYAYGNTLFVTFSAEFLEWMTKNDLEKRMCVYAIVNSLTETGRYNKVQIMVEKGEKGGERIRASEAGFTEAGEAYLEALSRNEAVILSPAFLAEKAFLFITKKDWSALYSLIADADAKVKYEIFQTLCNDSISSIDSYAFSNGSIAPDSRHAVVLCRFSVMKNGKSSAFVDVPMAFTYKDGVWKIDYSFFEYYLLREAA